MCSSVKIRREKLEKTLHLLNHKLKLNKMTNNLSVNISNVISPASQRNAMKQQLNFDK